MTKKSKSPTYLSRSQNRSLHLWFQLVADTLNEAGLDQRKVLKPEIDIPWTKESVKENLFKPIEQAMYQKKSTTQLTTKEIDGVVSVINRAVSDKFGVGAPEFPSVSQLLAQQDYAPPQT